MCRATVDSLVFVLQMSKRIKEIDWSKIAGASPKPKRLHLEEDESDGFFHCPVQTCDHDTFSTQRGCRKHVKNKHAWFYYFDSKPDDCLNPVNTDNSEQKGGTSIHSTKLLPSFDISSTIGKLFQSWLIGSGGGCKSIRQAQQVVRKSFKYLKFCCEDDEEELNWNMVDFSLSSPNFLFRFVDAMQTDWGLGHAGRLAYLDSISDLIDFRKTHGAPDAVLSNLNSTEVYLKRARKTVSKMMRLQWTNDLDIDTLESKGHWATLDELLQVVSKNLPRFESVLKICKEKPGEVPPSDLSFATKFLAVFLFIKVKGSRPMTYQYLTVDMVEAAKNNGGFIDQKKFKTTANYGFDSLLLTKTSMQVLDGYIFHIRPLLKPNCEYVLVNRNGDQHSRIGQLMSKMVFDATGKYIHPTRYRQIVETASHDKLNDKEQDAISEDQKHSSVVAKVHYQKQRSREVATRAHECLRKLQGDMGAQLEEQVCFRLSQSPSSSSDQERANESLCEDTEVPQQPVESNSSHGPKRKILLFTADEDKYLRAGINCHGYGHWSAILRDPRYKFQKGRTANSLLNRAFRKFK